MALLIKFYDGEKNEWDKFVLNNSMNGTFLQTRKFLDYHPKDRFKDCSVIIYKDNDIIAVAPACSCVNDSAKSFYSHSGSTYGGLVISSVCARLEILVNVLTELEIFLKENGFSKIVFKPTLRILCKEVDEAMAYAFAISGYKEYKELNLYIDFDKYNRGDVFSNFSKLKKRQVKKCIEQGIVLRELKEYSEIKDFHQVLSKNLLKFDTKPVHTLDELMDLKFNRFDNIIKFYGAYYDGKIVAGCMTFEFPNSSCLHTQYLAALDLDSKLSPMSFVYYSVICECLKKGIRYLSWGIATEHYGNGVNWGLMRHKEEFGSRHCINYIYEKSI